MLDRVGPYLVEREIGRGGMGVVYLARDTRLDRLVAIKALPPEVARDSVRLERFEREARTLATLNHPNLAGIYGVEEQDGARYLVLEFVDGETLADRLDRGPIPPDEAVELACQIAAGVEAAHEAGVVHRDLKPANIKITPDGRAKVLDFGLARADDNSASSSGGLDSPTMTTPQPQHSPTIAGAILGTAAYMSPEQARGRRVDKRSDIWSFGVILYEMLVGVSPFRGETASDSIGAVLHKDMDLSRLPPGTPARVRRVLERCLMRDKDLRYRDIGDVRLELLAVEAPSGPVGADRRARGSLQWAVLALAAALLGAGGWYGAIASRPAPRLDVRKSDLFTQKPEEAQQPLGAVISPNGAHVAYLVSGVIHLRDLASFEARALSETKDVACVFWAPDSQWLGYTSGHSVYKIALQGGGPLKVTDTDDELGVISGGGWTVDGRIIYADGDKGLMQVPARGGKSSQLLAHDEATEVDFHSPSVAVGTSSVLFVTHKRNLEFDLEQLTDSRRTVLLTMDQIFSARPCYAPTGQVLFRRDDTPPSIWAIDIDLDQGRAKGEPYIVLVGASLASVSLDGTLLVQRGAEDLASKVVRVATDGAVAEIKGDFEYPYAPILSPNGRFLAISDGHLPRTDLWVRDLERGSTSRLTTFDKAVIPIAWSPDSREIAAVLFDTSVPDKISTLFVYADGTGESRPPIEALVGSISRDWTLGLVTSNPFGDDQRLEAINLVDRSEPTPIGAETNVGRPALNPDGTLVAYSQRRSNRPEVYLTRFPHAEGRWSVSIDGGRSPTWSADGKTIFFESIDGDAIMAATVETEPELKVGIPTTALDAKALRLSLDAGWSPNPDGSGFTAVQSDPGSSEARTLSIITNWHEQFRNK